jgi:hypothetical protein
VQTERRQRLKSTDQLESRERAVAEVQFSIRELFGRTFTDEALGGLVRVMRGQNVKTPDGVSSRQTCRLPPGESPGGIPPLDEGCGRLVNRVGSFVVIGLQ